MKVLACALVIGVAAAVCVFHPLSPALPRAGIDPSWVAAMGEAADRPARFGVDTAFTYGPASPVVTGYLNGSWATRTLPLQIGFAALFGWCAALLVAARRPPSTGFSNQPRWPEPQAGSARAAFAGTALLALMLAAGRTDPDPLFLALPFAVSLLALRPAPGRAEWSAARLGAAALGLTAMVKMSFPLAALPLLAIADGVALARRRVPVLLALFALGVLGGALLYGQRLGDLPAYARMQGEVVAGYAGAMAIDGPDWDLYPFIALAGGLVAAAALLRRGPDTRPVALALAVALLFVFKAGFIRHDLHSAMAWKALTLLGALLAPGLPRAGRRGIAAAACLVALVYVPVLTVRQSTREGRPAALARLYAGMVEAPAREAAAARDALRDPEGFRARLDAAKAAAWAGIARATPLGDLPGTVDILPSEQTALLAAGLDYRGRPSFQEYSTYTASLEAANRAFLDGPDVPRWMLFGPESPEGYMGLDSRFPSLAEGALWPDLLRLYRPDHRIGDLLALERRAVPAPVAMGPAREVETRFGAFTPVGGGPAWATLDVRPNLAGRLLSALFRPPDLTLAIRLDDGEERRFRLVPALAAAGFLLSPLVDNASDYEALAAGRPAGAGRRVAGFAVEASGAGRLFYEPGIAATLRRLDVPPAAAPVSTLPAGRVAASGVVSLPIGDLPVAGERRRVGLGYGLDAGAERRVCFAVKPADGSGTTLWSACRDPGEGPGAVALDVPEGIEELALETRCGGDACPAFWTLGAGESASR